MVKKQGTVEAKLIINILVGLGSRLIFLESFAHTPRTTAISLPSGFTAFPLRYTGCHT